jgi:hypothetical protein
MIELGGSADQKYANVIINPLTGKFLTKRGDLISTGVEPIAGRPGSFRWWIDMDYVKGIASYDVAILAGNSDTEYVGNNNCSLILNDPQFEYVQN